MPNRLIASAAEASLYMLAGYATSPDFLQELTDEIVRRLSLTGAQAKAHILFPYDDWSRSRLGQIAEIRRDWKLNLSRRHRSVGGRRAVEAVKKTYGGGNLFLIGHSGGGVAAVHAAQLLGAEEGLAADCIVMVGSPRIRIAHEQQQSTLYLYGVNELGRRNDPVTRLGSWGGWERGSYRTPRWNPRLYAPAGIAAIPLLGGHADYFRRAAPFVDAQGCSNQEHTLRAMKGWLFP